MALIKNAHPKNISGAYDRLFDNRELGLLITKTHSAIISAGKELENIIISKMVPNIIDDLDNFLKQEIMKHGVFLLPKKKIKKSQELNWSGDKPDFVIFKRRSGQQNCHIIELKDGHVFDTKHVRAEKQIIVKFIEKISPLLSYKVSGHFCAFNQNDPKAIQDGFKNKITLQEAMTGLEFCELLEIDYDTIVKERKADGNDGKNNITYFLHELIKIDSIKDQLKNMLLS